MCVSSLAAWQATGRRCAELHCSRPALCAASHRASPVLNNLSSSATLTRLAQYQSAIEDRLFGFVVSAGTISLQAPLQRIKILLQTQDAHPRVRSSEVVRYAGWRDCYRRVVAEQGLPSLWNGNLIACVSRVPAWALTVVCKDILLKFTPYYDPIKQPASHLVIQTSTSAAASFASAALLYPLDLARTRLAAGVGEVSRDFKSLRHVLLKTSQGPSGMLSLYHGVTALMLRNVLHRALTITVYDTYHAAAARDRRLTWTDKFILSNVAVISINFALYPLETVAHRMQMQAERARAERLYGGVWDCVRKIVAEEGVRGLYKGGAITLWSVGTALTMLGMDEVMSAMGMKRTSK